MQKENNKQDKLTLGYWAWRGRGMPIRFLLEYLEIPYEGKYYQEGEQGKQEWIQNKSQLCMDLPNLPYIIDGEFYLSESSAILQYLPLRCGREDMLGKTVQEKARVQQLLNFILDYRAGVRNLCFEQEIEQKEGQSLGYYLEIISGF